MFLPQTFSLSPKSVHRSGYIYVCRMSNTVLRNPDAMIVRAKWIKVKNPASRQYERRLELFEKSKSRAKRWCSLEPDSLFRKRKRGSNHCHSKVTLIVENNAQERTVDVKAAVVLDETQFLEFVHEEVDPRTRCANHFLSLAKNQNAE